MISKISLCGDSNQDVVAFIFRRLGVLTQSYYKLMKLFADSYRLQRAGREAENHQSM